MTKSPFDYSICDPYADKVRAFFIVESNEDPSAMGDGGRALGLGQHHPSFFTQYYRPDGGYPASVSDTWIEAWMKATANFIYQWEHMGMDAVVQGYNLGMTAVLKGARNQDYLDRWTLALNKVHAQMKP